MDETKRNKPVQRAQQNQPRLILASGSPRRLELLESMGCQFSVQSADIDESQRPAEKPAAYVERLAQEKAQTVSDLQPATDQPLAVLAADTIVVQDDIIFTKPIDQEDAFRMWTLLQDKRHLVITGVCMVFGNAVHSLMVESSVDFGPICESQMHRYWKTGEPLDKAGGYAIQGFASAWVKLIHGSYSNVVGLPLRETNELLTLVDHNWL